MESTLRRVTMTWCVIAAAPAVDPSAGTTRERYGADAAETVDDDGLDAICHRHVITAPGVLGAESTAHSRKHHSCGDNRHNEANSLLALSY